MWELVGEEGLEEILDVIVVVALTDVFTAPENSINTAIQFGADVDVILWNAVSLPILDCVGIFIAKQYKYNTNPPISGKGTKPALVRK